MIGRLLLHDCIFQNIRAYYSMQANDNTKKKDLMGSDGSGNSISQKSNKVVIFRYDERDQNWK